MTGITQCICASYKLERYQGIHDLRTDTLKMALYGSAATLNYATTAYTTTGEISGTGYSAGGSTLAVASGYPKLNTSGNADIPVGSMVLLDFDDLTFSSLNVTGVMGALIYNSTQSNKAMYVLSFGVAFDVNGDLVLQWPTPDVMSAIVRTM